MLASVVRSTDNLWKAWVAVRANVLASSKSSFRSQVEDISKKPAPFLRKIQQQLEAQTFNFAAQKGRVISKASGGKRALVIAPIASRVVQRAILQVLQSTDPLVVAELGEIPSALRTPTSVGSVPKRGVKEGIALVQQAIEQGADYYIRSDIKNFFPGIPKTKIEAFIRDETTDREFSNLFSAALSTELKNADEIREFIDLFPTAETGVPQGSSLSAFAANVVLREFDRKLNGLGVHTIRYIDDFVIVGSSERRVRAAFASAQKELSIHKLKVYGPGEAGTKFQAGRTSAGFEFLGCNIRPNGVSPASKSVERLIDKMNKTLSEARRQIKTFGKNQQSVRRAEPAYVQALSKLDGQIRGWGDSHSFCDDRIAFAHLDRRISDALGAFDRFVRAQLAVQSAVQRRRSMGIAFLGDTSLVELTVPKPW